MARTRSLSGTPDRSALPERLGRLDARLDDLEDPEGAPSGGGFIIAPDPEREGVLNIETSDGKRWQIFPPLVTPEEVAALKEATTPVSATIGLTGATGGLTVTRIGTRCHLTGRIFVNRNSMDGILIGQLPNAYLPVRPDPSSGLPERPQITFAVGCEWEGFDPLGRCEIGYGGSIYVRARPGVTIDPHKVRVQISGRTSSIASHGHGKTAAQDTNHQHRYGDKTTDSNNASHAHQVNPAGGHDHSFYGETSGEFAQDPAIADDIRKFPRWFDLDGVTWDTGTPEQVPQ